MAISSVPVEGVQWRAPHSRATSDAPVDRPAVAETTALGAAWLAGVQAGLLPGIEAPPAHWRLDRRFTPAMTRAEAAGRHAEWRAAVARVRSGVSPA